jgi:hypothetical protein
MNANQVMDSVKCKGEERIRAYDVDDYFFCYSMLLRYEKAERILHHLRLRK